jgi:transcriptional regulator with XRE-family HTH domain
MPKPILELSTGGAGTASANGGSHGDARRSPLAELVSNNLRAKGMRQVDFCRQAGFDQGLLSKILSSVVNTLNVETALKLAEGLGLPPTVVFEAIGKKDVDELLRRFYSKSHRTDVGAASQP